MMLYQALVVERATWLRLRRKVMLRLLEGYTQADLLPELIAIHQSLTQPNRWARTEQS